MHVGSVGSCFHLIMLFMQKMQCMLQGLLLLLAGHWGHEDAVGGFQQQGTAHIQWHLPWAELEGESAHNRCQHDQSRKSLKCSGFVV